MWARLVRSFDGLGRGNGTGVCWRRPPRESRELWSGYALLPATFGCTYAARAQPVHAPRVSLQSAASASARARWQLPVLLLRIAHVAPLLPRSDLGLLPPTYQSDGRWAPILPRAVGIQISAAQSSSDGRQWSVTGGPDPVLTCFGAPCISLRLYCYWSRAMNP